jgi:hypothetical protein
MSEQSFCQVLPCPIVSQWMVTPFRGARPLGLNILWSVDRPGTRVTKYYMGKSAFTRACLSCVRDIMVIMDVRLVE